MRHHTRRILFYSFATIFIIATPIVVLYSTGLVLDFQARRLNKTGGFFVKTNETGIRVSANGIQKTETSFFGRGAMVNNLDPGTVAVEVAKDGFATWKKSIEIEEQLIQEFSSILLIPQKIEFATIATTTRQGSDTAPKALLPSPNGNILLDVTKEKGLTQLWLIAPASATRPLNIALPTGQEFASAEWNLAGDAVFMEILSGKNKQWNILHSDGRNEIIINYKSRLPIEEATSTASQPKFINGASIAQISQATDNEDFFYILDRTDKNVYRWQQSKNSAAKILSDIHSFRTFSDKIVFVTSSGFIGLADPAGEKIEILNRPGLFLDDTPCRIFQDENGEIAIIDSAGGLYPENLDTRSFRVLGGNFTNILFSPDDDKLGFIRKEMLGLILTKDERRQPFGNAFENRRLIDAGVPIHNFIWFNKKSTHLIFTTKDGVFITEADARFGPNTITLTTGQYLIAANPNNPNNFYLSNGPTVQSFTLE